MTSGDTTPKQQKRAYWAWVTVCVTWGTTYLAARIAIESYPPLLMAGTRHALGGAILALLVRTRGVALPRLEFWPGHALLGALMISAGNGFLIWAQQFVPSGFAAVMVSVIPFWMVGVEAMMPRGERLHARQLTGLLIGFGGIMLLTSSGVKLEGATTRQFLLGVIAMQCSCLGWSIGSAHAKRHARHEHVLAVTAMHMMFGGLLLMLVGTLVGEWPHWHYTGRSTAAIVYLMIVGSFIGYVSYAYALKHLPVSIVSLYAYANPVIAVLLGALLLDEPLTPRMTTGMAIIFLAMLIVRPAPDRPAADDTPADTLRS